MSRWAVRALWAALYVLTMGSPVLLSWAAPGELMDRLAVLTGLLAAAAVVCAAVLPSRVRSLTRTFGIESVISSHRWLGMFAGWAVIMHVISVVVLDPANVARLNIFTAPASGRTGTLAALALAGLAFLAYRRAQDYQQWRAVHIVLAGVMLVLIAGHVWYLDHLIEHPVMRLWFGALAAAVIGVGVYRWIWRRYFPRDSYRVHDKWDEAPGVFTIGVEPVDRHRANFHFAPGQFAWLRLRASLLSEEHPFTISSSAEQPQCLYFTVREVGDFTGWLARLRKGDRVWLDGPHGAFTSDHRWQTGTVMIAGGVGITPMMSMLRTYADRQDRRPHRLIVMARTQDDLLFSSELAELRQYLNLSVIGLVRQPADQTQPLAEIDEKLLMRTLPGPPRTAQLLYFVCGSAVFVEAVVKLLNVLGIPPGQIHTERFDHI
jgi:predicted ferric reductase